MLGAEAGGRSPGAAPRAWVLLGECRGPVLKCVGAAEPGMLLQGQGEMWHGSLGKVTGQGPVVWGTAVSGQRSPVEIPLAALQVLLPFAAVCIVCAILSHLHMPWESLDPATAQLSWANSTSHAPWLRIPYAGGGQRGWVQPSILKQSPHHLSPLFLLQVSGGGLC